MLKKYDNFIKILEDKVFESTIQNPNLSIVMPGGCNAKCDFCFWKKSTAERYDNRTKTYYIL